MLAKKPIQVAAFQVSDAIDIVWMLSEDARGGLPGVRSLPQEMPGVRPQAGKVQRIADAHTYNQDALHSWLLIRLAMGVTYSYTHQARIHCAVQDTEV